MKLYVVWNRDTDKLVMIAPIRVIGTHYHFHKDAENRAEANPVGADFYPKDRDGTRCHIHIALAENVTYDRAEASLPGV